MAESDADDTMTLQVKRARTSAATDPDDTAVLRVDVNGLGGLLCSLSLPEGSTINEAKAAIEKAKGVPVAEQRLLRSVNELPDFALVADVGRPGERVVELSLVRRDPERVDWLQRVRSQNAHHAGRLGKAPARIRQDAEVVLAAVAQDGFELEGASEQLQDDREVVLAAVAQTGFALRYASMRLRGDREVVLAAVGLDGTALRYASRQLRGDREVVLAAVTQNGFALEHAAEQLKGERELALAAVAQNGAALRFASGQLRADREVVLAAGGSPDVALRLAEWEARWEVARAAVAEEY